MTNSGAPGDLFKASGNETRSAAERKPILEGMTLMSCVAVFLAIAALLAYGSGRGLDLTDEIFYLIWARDPNAYALMYQPFGYLLHPLFTLCGGNIQAYRLAGFLIAAGSGVLLGYSLSLPGRRLLFSTYGAASALTIFFPWIITPSYNSAANVGAMITIAGILNARSASSPRRVLGIVAAAAGLCICAFAKPPLCAISVFVILVLALVSRSARVRLGLLAALALGAALTLLFVTPAEMMRLPGRILLTQEILSLPNNARGLPMKVLRDWLIVPPLLTVGAIAAAIGVSVPLRGWAKWSGYVALSLSGFYIWSLVPDAIDGSIPDFLGLALVTAATGYFSLRRYDATTPPLTVVLLLGAPAAVALGTFNNQWAQMTFSMAFAFLALFLLASSDPSAWRRRIVLVHAIAAPVAVMLLAAFFPYSLQDSIFEQQIMIDHPLTHDPIRVDEDTAAFVESAKGQAKGALLVDLSGTGPGVAAVLGGKAPVLPWLNPATASWPDVVWSRLSPQQRRDAWFVGPVITLFDHSAAAEWLAANQAQYCRLTLAPLTFWDKERTLEVWRPCRVAAKGGSVREAQTS